MRRAPCDSPARFGLDPDVWRPPSGRGPLDGLRFAAKEVFDMAGHVTRSGNPDWQRTHAPAVADAPAITRLLAAGAELCGRTLSDELAFSLAGENLHFGAPHNPRAPGRVSGGSSSGSAAAVAGGCVDFSLGTDTSGSVRIPASYCGIHGMRPTHGAISTQGVTPLAPSFDTVGWFARDACVLQAVGDVLLPSGKASGIGQMTVLADAWSGATKGVAAALRPAMEKLAGLAGVAVHEVEGLALAEWVRPYRILQSAEVWRSHGDWFLRTSPAMAPEIAARLFAGSQLTAAEIAEAHLRADEVRAVVAAFVSDGGVICLPSAPGVAPPLGVSRLPDDTTRMLVLVQTCIAGLCGLPQVSLPLGEVHGMPVGLGLIAGKGRDRDLLALAVAVEAHRRRISGP
ncbi:amidase [Variovorax sp. J2P1-59]|uniref:amidase n=1 Tax=Variovorax flavidus TaxID=3053501 RepID=UPI002574D5A3|nr:amidase [Variovorax sp. J2P1-59]MDM0078739.1 amidase [Variovorax sp. J2P1-59]